MHVTSILVSTHQAAHSALQQQEIRGGEGIRLSEHNQYLGSGQEGPEVQGLQRSCPVQSRHSFEASHLWKQ